MSIARRVACMFVLGLAAAPAQRAGAGGGPYVGPIPYLSVADNPFAIATPGFCDETFEDGTLDPEGVSGNGSPVTPGGLTDSVDGDDGAIDGSGNAGHSYFTGNGAGGLTFTFDPQRTGGLPTQAGMVWTDGEGTISFEAFDQNGASLGVYGPFDHADGGVFGTTGEDRFYGVTNAGGISAIKLSNTGGGIEVDHLTLNNTLANCVLPTTTTTTTTTLESTTSLATTSSSTSTSTSTSITSSTTSSSLTPTTSSTTSTTMVPDGCAGVTVGATFPSLNCRLADLIAAVQAEAQLGQQQPKLLKAGQKAKERKEAAEEACEAGDAKAAGRQLKKVVRKLIQFSHRLRSNNARRNIPAEIREPLAGAADEIRDDARRLKDNLSCAG